MKTIDDISLSDRDREVIRQAGRILKSRFDIRRVLLFGSKARGDDDSESDVDLLILTARSMSMSERGEVYDSLYDLQLEYNVCFSRLIVGEDDWENGIYQALPIHEEIRREGVVV